MPTTSSATSAAPAAAAGAFSGAERKAAPANADATAEQFEGLLWSSVLAPLSQSLGLLGDVLTNAMGTSAAREQHDAFYGHLRALIELSEAGDRPPSDDAGR